MRLSYLDILLSTATIFVVLFGISRRHENRPEVEGKSLALIAVVPQDGAVGQVTVRLTYRRGAEVVGTAVSAPGGPAEAVGRWTDTLAYRVVRRPAGCEVHVTGQPDRGGVIELAAEGRLTGTPQQLHTVRAALAARPQYCDQLQGYEGLSCWAKKGVALAQASAGLPGKRAARVEEWAAACPLPGGAGRLFEALRDAARRQSDGVRATVLAQALLVHDSLRPAARQLPRDEPTATRPDEVPGIKNALRRAGRHFVTHWGADCEMMRAYPVWEENKPFAGDVYFKTRQVSLDRDKLIEDLHNLKGQFEMGPYAMDDYLCHQLKPLRVYWVYAGESAFDMASWSDPQADGDVLRAVVAVQPEAG